MRKTSWILVCVMVLGLFSGCGTQQIEYDIAATTLPVYQFTSMLVEGTGLTVTRLVTESVSCLHDYSLNVRQVKAAEGAALIVINGAGLEDFMADILEDRNVIDASENIPLLEGCEDHEEHDGHHHHETDSHIWLSPSNAMVMVTNIAEGLKAAYPQHSQQLEWNCIVVLTKLMALLNYGNTQLAQLQSRELVTFHDGFQYFAKSFQLEIVAAVEEEAGSETSAHQLIDLIQLVQAHQIPAVFTESNGSDASAQVICREIGTQFFTLDMAMAGDDYFTAMYHNIDTIREALG